MFIMNISYFNLDHIYKSGQVFTWHKIDDGKYIIPFRDKAIKVEQRRDTISFSCSEEDFYNIWYNYFDLDTPYDNLHFKYRGLGGNFKISCNRCSGLHICRQDLFETIICCCLDGKVGVELTRQIIEDLLHRCGKKHKQSMRGEVIWYEFPSPKQILKKRQNIIESALWDVLDIDENIVFDICQNIVDGWLDLELLQTMDYEDAIDYLMEFKYINKSIAKKICLYGLHHMQSFPIDKTIKQTLVEDYEVTFKELCEWYLSEIKYVEHMGYLRQVLFYNKLYPVTETNYDWTNEKKKSVYGRSGKRRL